MGRCHQRAYEEAELKWICLSFMTLATLPATIAVVVDDQILVTVPAAGIVALGIAFTVWGEATRSATQLGLNVSGMILAGWAKLALQHLVWNRKARYRQRLLDRGRGHRRCT